MKTNINHPSILKFLGDVTNNILSSISIENYFNLPIDKKMNLLYAVFKLIRSSVPVPSSYGPSHTEFKTFITVLWKRNEELENYEFAAILNDIVNNFESISDVTKVTKKIKREVKKGQKND